MKLYLIENLDVAKQYSQLLKLSAECSKLKWSRTIKDIPSEITKSLDNIQNFVESRLYESCTEKTMVAELSSTEEDCMFSLFKKSDMLKSVLGGGVVLAGTQAKEVQQALVNVAELKKVSDALESGKNLIML